MEIRFALFRTHFSEVKVSGSADLVRVLVNGASLSGQEIPVRW
jgi:hypothetical protein